MAALTAQIKINETQPGISQYLKYNCLYILTVFIIGGQFCILFWSKMSSSMLDGRHIVFLSPLFVGRLYGSDNIVFIDLFVGVSRVGYTVIFVVFKNKCVRTWVSLTGKKLNLHSPMARASYLHLTTRWIHCKSVIRSKAIEGLEGLVLRAG